MEKCEKGAMPLPNDPLEPYRRMQEQMEALRRAQKFVPPGATPGPGVSIRYHTTGQNVTFGPTPLPAPEPLVEWLLEDLSPPSFHAFLGETAARFKTKGYRPGHRPKPEGLKLLKKRYDKDMVFRGRVGQEWLKEHKREEDALRYLSPDEIKKTPWAVVERFGFPAAYWLLSLSNNGALKQTATGFCREASHPGRLEELVANAKKTAGAGDKIWTLPKMTHEEALLRLHREAEEALEERDLWQHRVKEEEERRTRLEEELKKARDDHARAAAERAAAEKSRLALEQRLREREAEFEKAHALDMDGRKREKRLKELEHDCLRLKDELQKWAERAPALEMEKALLKESIEEQSRALEFIKGMANPPVLSGKTPYRGEMLLLLTVQEPAPFYEAAKKAGLAVIVHNGKTLDPSLKRQLDQAWRAIAWGDGRDWHEGLLPYLRENKKPFVILPALGADAFERILWNSASHLKNLK